MCGLSAAGARGAAAPQEHGAAQTRRRSEREEGGTGPAAALRLHRSPTACPPGAGPELVAS